MKCIRKNISNPHQYPNNPHHKTSNINNNPINPNPNCLKKTFNPNLTPKLQRLISRPNHNYISNYSAVRIKRTCPHITKKIKLRNKSIDNENSNVCHLIIIIRKISIKISI